MFFRNVRGLGVAPARQTEQPLLPGKLAYRGHQSDPRALLRLRPDACDREAGGTAWHSPWPRDDPAMDDGGRNLEGPPAAAQARASAAPSPRLPGRVDPDRRFGSLVVRDAPAALHPARLHRRRATSRLMHLQFVESESTFDYFKATRAYLERHGKPWHSIPTSTACSGSTGRTRPAATA